MKIIRYPQLKTEKGITYSREHIRRLEMVGKFPKHFALSAGGSFIGWDEQEIDEHLNALAAERDATGEAAQ